ncbi:MAG: hypothetical protein FJW30_02655 [Acidobacteria bacterium]|nr:hypothetical protein [Acidobacteriota bacterium]
MKSILLAALLLTAAHGQVYVGYAPSFVQDYSLGQGLMAGGDLVFSKGLGLNLDLSLVGFGTGSGFGIFSPSLTYHHNPGRKRKVVPFVSAGPAVGFALDGADARIWQVGGGATFWAKPRIGVRAEFRNHIHGLSPRTNLAQVRIGLAWR